MLLVEDLSTSTVLIKRSHTRTDDLNLTNIWDDVTPANNQSFWYTASRQLQNADGPWGDYTFHHDGARNRTQKIMDVGGTVTTHDFGYGGSDNRLAGVDEGLTTIRAFTYTANGNIASDDRGGTLHAYTWNNANRLKTVSVASSLKGTYIYNALEQQVVRTLTNMTPAGTIHSIHDRAGNLIVETDGFGNTWRGRISTSLLVSSIRALALMIWKTRTVPYTGRPRDATGGSDLEGKLFQVSAGVELSNGWTAGAGYKYHVEDDMDNHTVGVLLAKSFSFGLSDEQEQAIALK